MSRLVSVNLPHSLGVAEARRRIDAGFGQIQSQILGRSPVEVTKTWTGNALAFSAGVMGQSVTGRLTVLPDIVEIQIDLPELLALLGNSIKGRVKKQGQLLLEKK